MTFLENLSWRFATKKFDKNRKVSEQDLNKILEAIRLAPSSFGLQPLHVFVVSNKKLRNELRSASYDQPQVEEASYLLIFCARIDIENLIDKFLEISRQSGYSNEKLAARRKYLLNQFAQQSDEERWQWARDQVFIALGFALAACAELKIDSCPMGGFEPEEVDRILELPDNLRSVVYLAIGYRSEEPKSKKIRFSIGDLFTFI